MSLTNPTVFQSKSEQAKSASVLATTTLSNPAVAISASANLDVPQTSTSTTSIIDKAKTFLTKPITAGSKIQYWHVGLGAIVLFVLYVEMFADRKTQRKLKIW